MIHPLTQEAAELIAGRFKALSDPTRLRIIDTLCDQGEVSVSELTEVLETSQQNVSRHLAALHAEGYVARRKEKTRSLYRIADPMVIELCEQVCSGIETQLGQIGAVLSEQRPERAQGQTT